MNNIPKEEKKFVSVKISLSMWERWTAAAAARGITRSDLIREGVEELLNNSDPVLPGGARLALDELGEVH